MAVKGIEHNLAIPKGTTPLVHQVAGHVFGRKNLIGFLQSDDGFILKPVQGSGKGERELAFYREVFQSDCCDEVSLTLKKFLPIFYGTWTAQEHPGQLFIKLEDVTSKFSSPCIMDVKIGAITYDFLASDEKIARERLKFPALGEICFQLGGVKTCGNSAFTFDRTYVRMLDKDTILTKGIAAFFPSRELFRPALVQAFLRRLENIESWFLKQTSWQFFASSLLLVYDADTVCSSKTVSENNSSSSPEHCSVHCTSNGEKTDEDEEKWFESHVDVRMIDFAHVFPLSAGQSMDTNYLNGLRSLITYLKRLTATTYDSRSTDDPGV